VSFIVLGLLFAILRFTSSPRDRATVQNPPRAVLGIDTRMVSAFGFGLSVATAAAAARCTASSSRSTGSHYDRSLPAHDIVLGARSLAGAVLAGS